MDWQPLCRDNTTGLGTVMGAGDPEAVAWEKGFISAVIENVGYYSLHADASLCLIPDRQLVILSVS